MRKAHEKSIILGIGIGMIITSIAGMIYSAGNNQELGKEEIIRLAKGYGMVEKVPILNKGASTSTEADTSIADASEATNTAAANSSPSNSDERNIIVEIK